MQGGVSVGQELERGGAWSESGTGFAVTAGDALGWHLWRTREKVWW
jgi:hypothetical protein